MQTRRLRIEWQPGDKLTGLLTMPAGPSNRGVLLAHGAGAGQRHPFMSRLRSSLAAAGFPTLTFDYPYIEGGRRMPDRVPRLLQAHMAAAERLAGYVEGVVLAGRSMGGTVGSHLAGDVSWPAAGLVYFGYPLVPLGTNPPRSTEHLSRNTAPQLFWAGTRDRLSPPQLIVPLAERLPEADVILIEDADHGFHVPKRSGRTDDEVMAEIVRGTVTWLERFAARVPGGGR